MNRRHLDFQSSALPTELPRQTKLNDYALGFTPAIEAAAALAVNMATFDRCLADVETWPHRVFVEAP